MGLNGSEGNMRRTLAKRLRHLHFQSIESPIVKGIPDANYIDGWMELKYLDVWPAREDTKVKLTRFTKEQRLWITGRWRRGGRAFLVIQVNLEWVVIAGIDTRPIQLGLTNRSELCSLALLHTPEWDPVLFEHLITAPIAVLNMLRRSKGLCDYRDSPRTNNSSPSDEDSD